MTTTVLKERDHYAVRMGSLVVRQREGDQCVTLQFRRVTPPGQGEELQIEIVIETSHRTRVVTASASFVCPPDIADRIAQACTEVLAKHADPSAADVAAGGC